VTDGGLLGYDRHDVIYAYGPFTVLEEICSGVVFIGSRSGSRDRTRTVTMRRTTVPRINCSPTASGSSFRSRSGMTSRIGEIANERPRVGDQWAALV
jgi:hypothetical protein